MGLLSIAAENPYVVARHVQYAPRLDAAKLFPGFKRQNVFAKPEVSDAYAAITGSSDATPQPGEVFMMDKVASTPNGTVPSGEPGLVVTHPEKPDTFHVALPARDKFLGTTSLKLTEVTLQQADVDNPHFRDSTLAVGLAVVQLAQGNIPNPESQQ
jgi:hypothetical protein